MQKIITPQEFAQIRRLREKEVSEGKKPTLEDKLFEHNEVSAVLQVPYDDILILDDFELQERIGRGSFSEVFRALDPKGQEKAIKEFRLATGIKSIDDYEKNREMFQRELNLYRSLSGHPQIPDFHGVAARLTRDTKRFREFQPAIVMEYVAGRDLLERLQRKDISPEEVREVLMQVRSPLQSLHHGNSQERYHRDIKPANLKVNPEGTLYLLDFGSIRDELIGAYGGTLQVGSLGYAHKKQLDGEPSTRTDLYSLGRTLYALAIGKDLRNRDKFSRGKLNQTNLDSQLKDVIEMLCDTNLNGVQNVAELSDYLDRTPVVLEDVVAEVPAPKLASVSTTENIRMISGKKSEEPKEIASFYEGFSEFDVTVIKRVLGISTKSRLDAFIDFFGQADGAPVYPNKSNLTDNPYDITNPRFVEHERLRISFQGELSPTCGRLLPEIKERGLTPENIETRNKHEKRLREQVKVGMSNIMNDGKHVNIESRLRSLEVYQRALGYLSTKGFVPFRQGNPFYYALKLVIRNSQHAGDNADKLDLTEKKAYEKLPLTTNTVDFIRKKFEDRISFIEKQREKLIAKGSIDDVVEAEVVEAELVDDDADKNSLLYEIRGHKNELAKDKFNRYAYLGAAVMGVVGSLYLVPPITCRNDLNGLAIFGSIGIVGSLAGLYDSCARLLIKKKIKQLEAKLEDEKQLPVPAGEVVVSKKEIPRTWIPPLRAIWDSRNNPHSEKADYLKQLIELQEFVHGEGMSEDIFDWRLGYVEAAREKAGYSKSHENYDKLRLTSRKNRRGHLEDKLDRTVEFTTQDDDNIFDNTLREYRDLSKLEGSEDVDPTLYIKRWKMRRVLLDAKEKFNESRLEDIENRKDVYLDRIRELPFEEETIDRISSAISATKQGYDCGGKVREYLRPIMEEIQDFPEIKKMIIDGVPNDELHSDRLKILLLWDKEKDTKTDYPAIYGSSR